MKAKTHGHHQHHPHDRLPASLHEGSPNLGHPALQPFGGQPIGGVSKPDDSVMTAMPGQTPMAPQAPSPASQPPTPMGGGY